MADDEEKFLAILRRGKTYFLRDIRYAEGCRVVVNQAIVDHFDEHAVDYVRSEDGEVTGKLKFEIQPYDGDEPVGTALDKYDDPDDDVRLRREAHKERPRGPIVKAVHDTDLVAERRERVRSR